MRKEVVFAIIVGVAFGVIITFGAWRANRAINDKVTTSAEEKSNNPSQETSTTEFGLVLDKPENFDVITQNPIKIKGVTKANSWVTITSEDDDQIINSNESGAFEAEIELAGGVNQINVNAFSEDGVSEEEKLILIFSTEYPVE